MKKLLAAAAVLVLMISVIGGAMLAEGNGRVEEAAPLDYLVLVNDRHPLPDGWEDAMETVTVTNSRGKEVTVERTAYEAYLELKAALAQGNVMVDIDSAYVSVAEQQAKVDRLIAQNGESMAKQYATTPGYSEYHTGLAMNLYLIIDGKNIYKAKDMILYPEIWTAIQARLAEFGFILRYPYDKADVTGYDSVPWYIRYVGVDAAQAMKDQNLALEEYIEMLGR